MPTGLSLIGLTQRRRLRALSHALSMDTNALLGAAVGAAAPAACFTLQLPLASPASGASSGERYMARGVSAGKEDVHAAIAKVDKGLYPKAFCKVVPDIAGDPEWCTCMHADGAGTKSSLAYMYWKETGDLSVWRGIAQDSVIMNTDDLLCIGCVDGILMSSTIGRNKSKIPGEVLTALIGGTEDVLKTLRDSGVGIISTGGETADLGDLVRTVVVDSTVTARMPRKDVIVNSNIKAGDVVVGLASYGQATYEDEYSEPSCSPSLAISTACACFRPALSRSLWAYGSHIACLQMVAWVATASHQRGMTSSTRPLPRSTPRATTPPCLPTSSTAASTT